MDPASVPALLGAIRHMYGLAAKWLESVQVRETHNGTVVYLQRPRLAGLPRTSGLPLCLRAAGLEASHVALMMLSTTIGRGRLAGGVSSGGNTTRSRITFGAGSGTSARTARSVRARSMRRCMKPRPKSRSAKSALCALQSRRMLDALASPVRANGCSWCSSSGPRCSQRRPAALTKVHWPPSRASTWRRTACGMCRLWALRRSGLPARGFSHSSRCSSAMSAGSESRATCANSGQRRSSAPY